MAILNLGKEGSNVVEAIIEAVSSGYRDDLILEELAQAVEDELIAKEKFESAVDVLDLYLARFTESIDNISNAMRQFEFNEKRSVLKNRPMNLAQQVLKDVEGFNNASNEFYNSFDEVDENEKKESDIEKSVNEKKEADIEKPELVEEIKVKGM